MSRKRHDPAFKAKVAAEVLKGIESLSELPAEYGVHPVQISLRHGHVEANKEKFGYQGFELLKSGENLNKSHIPAHPNPIGFSKFGFVAGRSSVW